MKHAPETLPNIEAIKARQKAIWESGDFGEVAKFNVPAAREFMARIELRAGMNVLDAACGTGNLAVLAAQCGCKVSGVDIAANLIQQARERARQEGLAIEFTEGDAEAMPYPDGSFDAVLSMYGVMFAPRPERVASELARITRRGGLIALANWTPEGFIGKMIHIFARYLPPPAGLPSPILWGNEETVRARLADAFTDLRLTRRIARLRYPYDPAGTVEFFRRYFGPTQQAFAALPPEAQSGLRCDLEAHQALNNISTNPTETDTAAEYLEIIARRV